MIAGAARYLMLQGPVTAQERWEEQSGYSPSTLATIIAGLVCAADFARESNAATADFLLAYADWLHAHLEDWLVTSCGELLPGKPRHFLRITPTDKQTPDAHPDMDTLEIDMANGVGPKPARNVVGGDFLHLVRLGLRDPHDLLIRDTLEVIDAVLRRDLPQGPCWRRYNHDAYGQKDDGHAYDGTGVGRSWPILTGERGHYELAAGRDPLPFITTLEKMANEGGMLSEQLWDADDLPGTKLTRGAPTAPRCRCAGATPNTFPSCAASATASASIASNQPTSATSAHHIRTRMRCGRCATRLAASQREKRSASCYPRRSRVVGPPMSGRLRPTPLRSKAVYRACGIWISRPSNSRPVR